MTDPRLAEVIERSRATDLPALIQAKERAKKAMLADSSEANIRAFDRACRALEEALARMGEEDGGGEDPEAGPLEAEEYPNLLRVLEALKAEGWKVSRSTLYEHARRGLLRPRADGRYPRRAVERYARRHLRRLDGSAPEDDDIAALQRAKLRAEKEKTEAQARHWELRTKIERGYYLRRSDVEAGLAARALVLRAGYEDMVRSRVDEMVELVGGDPARAQDLAAYLLAAGEDWFAQYAEARTFVAVVTGAPDPDEEAA